MDSAMYGQPSVFWAPASYQAAPPGMPGAYVPAADGYAYGGAGPYLQRTPLYSQPTPTLVGNGYPTPGPNASYGFVSSNYVPFQGSGYAGGNAVAWEPAAPYAAPAPFPAAAAAPPIAAPSYAYQGYQGFHSGSIGPIQGQSSSFQMFTGYDYGQAAPHGQAYEYTYVSAACAAAPAPPPAPLPPAAQALPARHALGLEFYPVSNSAGRTQMQDPSGDGRLQPAHPSPRPTLSINKRPPSKGPSSPLAAAKRSRTAGGAAAGSVERRAAPRASAPHSPSVLKGSPKLPAVPAVSAPKPLVEHRAPAAAGAESAAAEGKEEEAKEAEGGQGGAGPPGKTKRERGDSDGRPIPIASTGNARRLAMRVAGAAESYMRCLDYRTFESVLSLGCDIAWALFPDPRKVEGEPQTVVLVDSEGREWPCKYHTLVAKHSYVLRLGWRDFVEARGVAKNDIVVLSKDEQNLDGLGQAKVRIDIVPRREARRFMAERATRLSAAAAQSAAQAQEDPADAAAAAHAAPDGTADGGG